MISSSDPRLPMTPNTPTTQATPWALDELPMPDAFSMPEAITHHAASRDTMDAHAQMAAERTRLEADAYTRGYEDAVAAARNSADARLAAALGALAEATASVRLHESRWTANCEENLAALAIVVARHIVQREVSVDQSIVRELVQRALSQFPIDQTITVRLHPDDVASCNDLVRQGVNGLVQDVRFMPDPHVNQGGCLVEGRERIIDGRVDTSLERAYRSLGQVQST